MPNAGNRAECGDNDVSGGADRRRLKLVGTTNFEKANKGGRPVYLCWNCGLMQGGEDEPMEESTLCPSCRGAGVTDHGQGL